MRAAWASLERVWPQLGTGADFREFAGAGRALCETTPLDRGPFDPAEAAAVGGAMARLAELVVRSSSSTSRRLAWLAALRLSLLALGVAAFVVVGAVLPIRHARAPKDLALGRPVTLSSVTASRKDVGGAYLVNGKLEWSFGAHTDHGHDEKDPFMTIDLGAQTHIGKIVVYNRGDQNFDDCLPPSPSRWVTTLRRRTL